MITHLDGRGVQVTSPPGKIIKHADTIVLRGEGMPIHKQPNEKGDLYLTFTIEMPDDEWLKTVDRKVKFRSLSQRLLILCSDTDPFVAHSPQKSGHRAAASSRVDSCVRGG